MIEFLGKNNFANLNFFTFQHPPEMKMSSKKCVKTKDAYRILFSKYFNIGEFYLNVSQILQWFQFLFHKNEKKPFFHDEKVVITENENNSIVFQKFGNKKECDGLSFIKKTSKNSEERYTIWNEYLIAAHCMNYIRCLVPHFSFSYYLAIDGHNASMYQEYIKGKTIKDYVFNAGRVEPGNSKEFLEIFLQVLVALETAQNFCFFTHNDLHGENILLRENTLKESKISVVIHNQTILFEKPKFVPTIIDFGLATAANTSNSVISNIYYCFPQYGYFPFFTSGTDMLKIIAAINAEAIANPKTKMKEKIFRFCNFLLREFFQIHTTKYQGYLNILAANYYNLSCFPVIYKTPMQLFEFILTQEKKICDIFEIAKLPVMIEKNHIKDSIEEKDLHLFQDLFCLKKMSNFCKKETLYQNTSKIKNMTIQEMKNIDSIYKNMDFKKFPTLTFDNLFLVKDILKRFEKFISYYEYGHYEFCIQSNSQKDDEKYNLFMNNITDKNAFYKFLKTLEFYSIYLQNVETNSKKLHKHAQLYKNKLVGLMK